MKKSELTQLTQIIEHIVAKEVRKQLPSIIAETFQNMMGKSVVTDTHPRVQPVHESTMEEPLTETPTDFKTSLRELFAGTSVMSTPEPVPQVRPIKQYAKDPVLNKILNETTSNLQSRERMVGAAAFAGGYSPMDLAPDFSANTTPLADDATFTRNMPEMQPQMRQSPQVFSEGSIPVTPIPPGTAPAVVKALTRNYSQMMKLIDKKKKGIA